MVYFSTRAVTMSTVRNFVNVTLPLISNYCTVGIALLYVRQMYRIYFS